MIHGIKVESGTEALALGSATAVIAGGLYNWGFLRRYDGSLLSVLTPQDYLASTLVAFGVLVAFGLTGLALGEITSVILKGRKTGHKTEPAEYDLPKSHRVKKLLLLGILTLAVTNSIGYVDGSTGAIANWALLYFVISTLSLIITAMFAMAPNWSISVLVVSAALFLSYGIGRADFEVRLLGGQTDIIQMKDGTDLQTNVIKVTSNFIFLHDGNRYISVVSWDEVRSIGNTRGTTHG
jgi:hypothetical protein